MFIKEIPCPIYQFNCVHPLKYRWKMDCDIDGAWQRRYDVRKIRRLFENGWAITELMTEQLWLSKDFFDAKFKRFKRQKRPFCRSEITAYVHKCSRLSDFVEFCHTRYKQISVLKNFAADAAIAVAAQLEQLDQQDEQESWIIANKCRQIEVLEVKLKAQVQLLQALDIETDANNALKSFAFIYLIAMLKVGSRYLPPQDNYSSVYAYYSRALSNPFIFSFPSCENADALNEDYDEYYE